MKPGFKTTEFWQTTLLHALTAVVVIASTFGYHIDSVKLQPLIPVGALIASAIAQAFYSASRASVKVAASVDTPTNQDPGGI